MPGLLLVCVGLGSHLGGQAMSQPRSGLTEINPPASPSAQRQLAIVGATLIDGRGGPAVPDSVVLLRGDRIEAAGPKASVPMPAGAEVVPAAGQFILPGFLDSHFHVERDYELPALFLSHGITSIRDPGQWINIYDPVRRKQPMPRFFLCGPHLDCAPPAYPMDAFLVDNAAQTRDAVRRFVKEGASAIKVYFRLRPELVRAACETAHQLGVPVTAHLELVNATDAIEAGIDGVEHVTSFGTALSEPAEAEQFVAAVTKDNNARRLGRYELWSRLDLDGSPRVKPLLDLIVRKKVVLSPTLAVFERREGDPGATETQVSGFKKMIEFIRRAHRAGATSVVGSHSSVPKAERGWAYHREMELLVECGLTPAEAIRAGTLENARFFRADDRLGSIEPGKSADMVLLDADPLRDIRNLRRVRRVMLNGEWVGTRGSDGVME